MLAFGVTIVTFIFDSSLLMILLIKLFEINGNIKRTVPLSVLFCAFETIFLIFRELTGEWFGFEGYLAVQFLFALIYSQVFIKGKFFYKFTTIVVYYCSCNATMILSYSLSTVIPGNIHTFFISKPLLLLVVFCLSKLDFKTQYDLPHRYWAILITIPLLNYIILILMKNIEIAAIYNIPIVSATLIINISFYLIYSKIVHDYEKKLSYYYNNQYLQLQIQSYEENMRNFSTINTFNHDIKNHILCMRIMLDNKNYDKLHNYFTDFSEEISPVISQINTGNNVIDAILSAKSALAHTMGIPLSIHVEHIPPVNIKGHELCAVLSNLIDNALEASENTNNPCVKIQISLSGECLFIVIANRIDDDVLKNNPKLITTKENKEVHGIGLQVVKNIISKYEGQISTKVKDNYFYVRGMINIDVK